MNIDLDTSTLSLPRDGLIAVRDAHGTRVTAVKGALWITEDHERGDTILEAGQTFTIRRPGLTLIMALEPASLRLAERRCSLSARIVGWLSSFLPPARVPPSADRRLAQERAHRATECAEIFLR